MPVDGVALVQAVQEVEEIPPRLAGVLADARRDLVHRPEVAERDVVSRGDHAPAELLPGLEPCPPVGRHPRLPRRQVCLGHRMEARAERSDSPRLIRAGHRLVARDGRDRDVVIGAVRRLGREVLRKPVPVGVRVERDLGVEPAVPPERLGSLRGHERGLDARGLRCGGLDLGRDRADRLHGLDARAVDGGEADGLLVAAERWQADDEILGLGLVRSDGAGARKQGDEREHCDRQGDASHDGLLVDVIAVTFAPAPHRLLTARPQATAIEHMFRPVAGLD